MAKPIDIAVKVTDAASQPLKEISKELKSVGRSAGNAAKKFQTFDRQIAVSAQNLKVIKSNFGKTAGGINKAMQVSKASINDTLKVLKQVTNESKRLQSLSTNLNRVAKSSKKASSASAGAAKGFSNIGKAASKSEWQVANFNRRLFFAVAFVHTFTRAASKLGDAMMEGAKMDRVATQFERAVGPKGKFISAIKDMTDNSIDYMEAMRSGIAMSSLGISKDMGQIAGVVARAGTAAKMAGLESSEGIKRFTQFMKDGSMSHLEFLNMLRKTDTGLIMSESILAKYGGVMGKVMTVSQRMAIAQSILRKVTKSSLKGQRDYADILLDLKQAFQFARKEASLLITAALGPLLDKVKDLVWRFSSFVETIRKSDKETVFFVKSLVVGTAAVTGFAVALGTLKLTLFALGSLGVGIPVLLGPLGALLGLFLAVGKQTKSFRENLKVLGAVFKGTYQLVSSFLTNAELYKKGIGEMDKSTADLLKKHGLFDFVQTISKAFSIVSDFVRNFYRGFVSTSIQIKQKLADIGSSILEFIGLGSGVGSRKLLNFFNDVGKSAGRVTSVILSLVAAYKGLKLAKGLLSGIPIIGKLFGKSSSNEPKGTASDPIYTKQVMSKSGIMSNILGKGPSMPGIAGIAAALKGVGSFASVVIVRLVRLAPALLRVSMIFGALALLGKAVYDNWEKVSYLGQLTWDIVSNSLNSFKDKMLDLANNTYDNLTAAWGWVKEKIHEFGSFLSEKFSFLEPVIEKVKTQFTELYENLKPLIRWLVDTKNKLVEKVAKSEVGQKTKTLVDEWLVPAGQALASTLGMAVDDPFATMGKGLSNTLDMAKQSQPMQDQISGNISKIGSALMTGDKDTALNTTAPDSADREMYLERLKEQLTQAKSDKLNNFTKAYNQARDVRSESGRELTASEYEKIMRATLGEAVTIIREPLKSIDEKTEVKTSNNNRSKRSGTC